LHNKRKSVAYCHLADFVKTATKHSNGPLIKLKPKLSCWNIISTRLASLTQGYEKQKRSVQPGHWFDVRHVTRSGPVGFMHFAMR